MEEGIKVLFDDGTEITVQYSVTNLQSVIDTGKQLEKIQEQGYDLEEIDTTQLLYYGVINFKMKKDISIHERKNCDDCNYRLGFNLNG